MIQTKKVKVVIHTWKHGEEEKYLGEVEVDKEFWVKQASEHVKKNLLPDHKDVAIHMKLVKPNYK